MVRQLVFLLRWCATATLLLLCGIVSPGQAGIRLLGEVPFELERLLADEASSSNCACAVEKPRSLENDEPTGDQADSQDLPWVKMLNPAVQMNSPTGPSQGSTSGTTFSGLSGPNGPSCLSGQAIVISHDQLVARLAGELALCLPAPPGVELFHPPKYCCQSFM
jgi:hypothetical protein